MSLDPECVRTLLLFLDQQLAPTSAGKRPKPVKLKHKVEEPPLSTYSPDAVYAAAQYIVGKKFAQIAVQDPKNISHLAPRHYVFTSLTAKGSDFLSALRDDTIWKKLTSRLGNVFEATLPQLLSAAAELGLKLFPG